MDRRTDMCSYRDARMLIKILCVTKKRVETVKRESKWQNASRNGKKRVETAKCESIWQNASRNGKTRVETAKHLKISGWTHLKDPLM